VAERRLKLRNFDQVGETNVEIAGPKIPQRKTLPLETPFLPHPLTHCDFFIFPASDEVEWGFKNAEEKRKKKQANDKP